MKSSLVSPELGTYRFPSGDAYADVLTFLNQDGIRVPDPQRCRFCGHFTETGRSRFCDTICREQMADFLESKTAAV